MQIILVSRTILTHINECLHVPLGELSVVKSAPDLLIHALPEHVSATIENTSRIFDNFYDVIFLCIGHLHEKESLQSIHHFDNMLTIKLILNKGQGANYHAHLGHRQSLLSDLLIREDIGTQFI